MMWMRGVARPRRRRGRDAGTTLVELLVAMGLFVVLITVFMSSVVSMTRMTARTQGVSDSTTSAHRVLDRFDRQVRYSTGVNSPGLGGTGAYYVEYLAAAQAAGATPICTQWRYDRTGRTVASRTWTDSATPSPTAWNILATNVRNAVTDPPFVLTFATAGRPRQQLTVTLDIGPAARAGAQVSSTYVARNTTKEAQPNADLNNDSISDNPVCRSVVGRP